MTAPVRLRIAPSPTGEPHVGTAYTALFNLLLAKKLGGEMILRIEDTDQSRSTPDSERKVLEALEWLGFEWTEGPDKGGDFGPYRQSERRDTYGQYVDRMLEEGNAFKCFCTPERLDEMRKDQRKAGQQPKYDGLCKSLSAEQVAEKEAAGIPHVVRMNIPEEGECQFSDAIYGDVSIPWATVDMQVVMKSDGMPTYHMANVVDDHLMGITHVARGEEWMSSVPKHLLLYRYLGWEPPRFYHLPLLRNPDKTKLSKRRNPTSMSYFQAMGFLPEAMTNFLGLAFISIAEGEEMMDMDELIAAFDPANTAKAGAVFDMQKLDWLNGRWIREKLDDEEYRSRVLAWAMMNARLEGGLDLARQRITKLSDLPDLTAFLFRGDLNLSAADFEKSKTSPEDCLAILKAVSPLVDTLAEWNTETLEAAIREIADEQGRKMRKFMPPLFIALTGSNRSLPLFNSMELLGRSVVRQRLKQAIGALGA
ncbi:MAG: glutamate--tRNA ligase [Magnetovibrionaceae bacterium]